MSFRRNRGFTLVELLVVIAIIGILASGVIAALGAARQKSRDVRRIADLREIANALHLYNNDNSAFPANLSDLASGGYIPGIPPDPLPSNNPYAYRSAECATPNQSFVLRATLERAHGALDNDIDGNQCTDLNCSDSPQFNYCIDQ